MIVCLFSKAKNLFEVLLESSPGCREEWDPRLNQLINCMHIFFDCSINDLLDEYNELKNMIRISVNRTAKFVKANYGNVDIYKDNCRVANIGYLNTRIVPKCLIIKPINHQFEGL